MSIVKQNINLPDTLKTLSSDKATYTITTSLFIHFKGFSFTTEQIQDSDYWFSQLGENIIPFHGITEFTPEDDEALYNKSKQDFTYKTKKGTYRHKVKFDWNLDKHQTVNDLNGQEVYVIYISNRTIRATKEGNEIRGFKTSMFELENMMFGSVNSTGDSELKIELFDSDELNVNGYEVEVDWLPQKINRLHANIELTYGDGTLTMGVDHLGAPVTDIAADEITINDTINGDISFSTFVAGSGVYQLSDFSDNLRSGTICFVSTLYMGRKEYRYSFTVQVYKNFELISGDNFELISGDNFELLEKV